MSTSASGPPASAAELAGLLSEPGRLRVVAALALGAKSLAEVAASTDLDHREVTKALNRLQAGGLVSIVDGAFVLNSRAFKDAARDAASRRPPDEPVSDDPAADVVLRRFIIDGRLVSFPTARGKRRKVLEHIAMTFEPGVRYPEREVNAMLRAWHSDYAALRRYLVDEELLERGGGVYWRVGGPVVV